MALDANHQLTSRNPTHVSDRPPKSPLRFVRLALLFLAAGIIVFAVIRALPPRSVTIEIGPLGGSYHEIALKYRDVLRAHGIEAILRPQPDSLDIIDDVDRVGSDVDIGFTAQVVKREQYPRTAAAAVIEYQPLFMFYNISMGEIATLTNLRGKRIVMPPERSATSAIALRTLSLYDVTPTNSHLTFMPLADAVRALKAGQFDAGIFMLAPDNAIIVDLINSDSFRLLSTGEEKGITRHLPFLRTVVLPRGSYDVENNTPPDDATLVAAPVNVIVRKDIHPAVLYTLLEAMDEVHYGSTLVSDPGEFPSVVGTVLAPHKLAAQYAKLGMPWIYRNLPLWFASLIESYLIVGLVIFILIECFKSSKYLGELIDLILQSASLRILRHIERTARPGRPVTGLRSLMVHYIERTLFRVSRRKRNEELIGRIRSYGDPNDG
jgi:TRAP-type uncharacterized transport system substrate-binding protein